MCVCADDVGSLRLYSLTPTGSSHYTIWTRIYLIDTFGRSHAVNADLHRPFSIVTVFGWISERKKSRWRRQEWAIKMDDGALRVRRTHLNAEIEKQRQLATNRMGRRTIKSANKWSKRACESCRLRCEHIEAILWMQKHTRYVAAMRCHSIELIGEFDAKNGYKFYKKMDIKLEKANANEAIIHQFRADAAHWNRTHTLSRIT